ncbi:MAG: hypothetical protein PHW69_01130 [Elusimicrobiaceae bacterium]|nr:hypothetical protein [Elusimicrobiaceae bacterium]
MQTVTKEILDSVAASLNRADQAQAQNITHALGERQPAVMGFLFNAGEGIFNEEEREWFSYLGIALLKSALETDPKLPAITGEMLEDSAADAVEFVRILRQRDETKTGLPDEMTALLAGHKQPEMIKFLVAAMSVASQEETRKVRDDCAGTMFFFLKILIDTIDRAAAPEA